MDNIAVLIPCYNEENTIEKVIEEFKKNIPGSVIYVYDNNSTDSSVEKARNAGAIVRYEKRQGKGNVIRRMFREVEAEIYIMVDADDTYPAEAATALIEKIEDGADMAVGDRLNGTYFTENKRRFHNSGNTFVRKSINWLFHNSIKDIMTGYRAFSYRFVKTFPVLSHGFEIETEMSIHAVDKNLAVENVIIDYQDRPEGSESKLNTVSDGMKVLRTIARLFRCYQPQKFFGAIAALLLIISLLFFVPILCTYFADGLVPRFPTLVVCGFTALAAVQCFFAGMQLQNIVQKNKQDFEMQLQHAMKEQREAHEETH